MSVNDVECMQCLLSNLNNVICDSGAKWVIIGGDLNFNFDSVSTVVSRKQWSTVILKVNQCHFR